jgi:hypothetical protein
MSQREEVRPLGSALPQREQVPAAAELWDFGIFVVSYFID